jgi:hypothetical protein
VRVELIARHRLQVAHVADGVGAVGVRAEGGCHQFLVEQKPRVVFGPLPLADDDGALGRSLVGVEE